MRQVYLYILLLAVSAILFGCGAQKAEEIPQTTEVYATVAETTAPQPITVSPLAASDLLEPLDNYSWAREYPPEYVMLHFTSAVVLSKDDPYNMESVRKIFEDGGVSIHYIIDRDGSILCHIPEDRAAWHAGKGTFAEDERLTNAMNKYSIGIEMLAIGSERDMAQYLTAAEYRALDADLIGFTDAQYTAVKELVEDICLRNGIPMDAAHVIGHDMYNPAKSDPGELFDWNRMFE